MLYIYTYAIGNAINYVYIIITLQMALARQRFAGNEYM